MKSRLSLEVKPEDRQRYAKGTWVVGYAVIGEIKERTLTVFLELLKAVKGHETGWPPWWVPTREEIKPYKYDDLIECWLWETHFDDAAHSDFWRASPQGRMFLLRGYQEDSGAGEYKEQPPGTALDLTLPIWRTGECLLHAARLATVLAGETSSVLFRITWNGLRDRTLMRRDYGLQLVARGKPKQDEVTSKIQVQTSQIGGTLPELVHRLTQPLYESFDFFSVPIELIQDELKKMRRLQ